MAESNRPQPRNLLDSVLGAPLAVVLILVAFVMVNVLSARHYKRFDWTRHSLFTLAPRSREIARGLSGPTDIYVLLGANEPQYHDVIELVERYTAESRLLHSHVIDPDRQRDRFLDLTQRLGIRVGRTNDSDVAAEAAIVLTRGDRHWEIARESLAGLGDEEGGEEGGSARTATAQITVERAISEGLLHVDRNETSKVCFATGHGELTLEGGDSSMSQLATELHHSNVTTDAVAIAGNANVPSDCDALVIAGPRQAFTTSDADIVTRYIRAGGNVLLLVDPSFVSGRHAPSGLEPVAALGGIELTRSVVLEPDEAHQVPGTMPYQFLATEFGEHAITREIRGQDARVLVDTSRALRRIPDSSVIPESLLRTTPNAWGETGGAEAGRGDQMAPDASDIRGPIHLAMAAQIPGITPNPARHHDAAGRLVVFGYSLLATNEALSLGFQARFVNGYLIESSIGWLTARRELVEIPPRPTSAAALNVSREDIGHVRLYTMLLVPLAAALVGIAVWRARKAA